MREFNTAGPCDQAKHYLVPPEPRLPQARGLIDGGSYFVLHAPRQSGKTTVLRALAQALTAEGTYAALHFSCETAEPAQDDYVAAQRALLGALRDAADDHLPPDLRPPPFPDVNDGRLLTAALRAWALTCTRPLVLFFDEIDALRGESLRSVLRQLRDGFLARPEAFPHSVVLCGLRDVRDYKVASGGQERLGTSSPFNIKVESLTLGTFTREQVKELYLQHTRETGQKWTKRAITLAHELSGGQPWLVNALAREIVEKMGHQGVIRSPLVHKAKEQLIAARHTHLDSLVARLTEPRVKRVLEPLMAGEPTLGDMQYNDDLAYVRDLGLVAPESPVRVANPIYREVMVRVMTDPYQEGIVLDRAWYRLPSGRLSMGRVIHGFLHFWREHGDVLGQSATYHEVAPQLVLMAWLQRIVNGGGFVDREYGVGTGRIDVLVRWPVRARVWQREAIELKVWKPKKADPLAAGLRQLDGYLDRLHLKTGTLVLFDRRPEAEPIEQRCHVTDGTTPSGRTVRVVRA
jgi:tRNA A37 threonylcarbamoyladenosine biosynthesis protein TsaE